MRLKVCDLFLVFCKFRAIGVFEFVCPEFGGSETVRKAWSLEEVVSDMFAEYSLLHQRLPFTFRDTVLLVTLFQRVCLDTFAMLEYLETSLVPPSADFVPAFGRWMGVFTMDFDDCQTLFESRILVWLIRKQSTIPNDINVHKIVEITRPSDIVTEPQEFSVGQILKWDSRQYYAGESWHWQTWRGPTVGLEQFAPPPTYDTDDTNSSRSVTTPVNSASRATGPSRTQKKSNARQERCKYVITLHF